MKHKTLETFVADNRQHGWRVRGKNGRIVAVGGETFKGGHRRALKAAVAALDLRAIDCRPHATKPNVHVIERMENL